MNFLFSIYRFIFVPSGGAFCEINDVGQLVKLSFSLGIVIVIDSIQFNSIQFKIFINVSKPNQQNLLVFLWGHK